MSVAQRLERLRGTLEAAGLDALLVTNPENRRYLSGYTGRDGGLDSAGTLLIGTADVVLITDGRYTEQAARECPDLRVAVRQAPLAPLAAELIREWGCRRLGIEATHLTVAQRDDLEAATRQKGIPPELVPTRGVVEAQRVVKDTEEIAAIERAVRITDEVFEALLGYLRPGLTERDVAVEIARQMRAHGAEDMAFDPIVASGPNGALPHAVPGDRALALGETITIDMGARYAGYCSDMTRTVCLGEAPTAVRAAYDAVLRAQRLCEEGLRPGLNGQEADALARGALEAAGRGEQYVHGTGHGLGLEIHEDPRLGRLSAEYVLAAGMVVTVEPGVYVTGWGGVRIEDTVLVIADGARVLSRASKQLVVPHSGA